MRRLALLSNSEEKTFRACERKHHFAYRLLVRPIKKATPLRFGTLIHHGLEKWWRTGGDLEAAIAFMRGKRTADTDAFELIDAECLLTGYHARWKDAPYRALAVEALFEAPMVHPATGQVSDHYAHAGKMDAVAEHEPTGEIHLVEHKSSSEDISLGSDYWKRLRLDSQISKYVVGSQALGWKIDRVLYDVVRRVTLEPKKATPPEDRKYTKPTKAEPVPRLYANQRENDETVDEYRERVMNAIAEAPDKYYARGFVVRLDRDLREWAYDSWSIAQRIRAGEANEHYPRNPDACSMYGRNCEYMPVCIGEASIDDPTLYRRATVKHEELAAE